MFVHALLIRSARDISMMKPSGLHRGLLAVLCIVASAHAQVTFSNAVTLGTVHINGLDETSGIAASRQNEGVLWTHNDSGDMARVFALDTQGRLLGTYKLPGAVNFDYEDIAIGPGPAPNVDYVFVGDIGDNFIERSSVTIYQFPEPAVYLRQFSSPANTSVKGLRTIVLTYPDGARNAEALLVDPWSGDTFIASKETNLCRIYMATKAQMDAGGPITLSFVRELAFDQASAGDISPTGREIILRQENFARLWPRASGQSVGEALGGPGVSIPVVGQPTEDNGEAIGFDSNGSGYFTLSDGFSTQPLYYFGRSSSFAKPPRALVRAGGTWRYLDTGTNLGTAWRAGSYNDAAWRTGDGQFGYGDGAERTTVSFGPKSNAKFITTYFRKSFVVTNSAGIGRLDLKLVFDDGAAVYLNGTLIALANLSSNATATTLASVTQEDLEEAWFTFVVNQALLIEGTNTLAVEVHQAAVNSPDLSFDAQLIAFESSPPPRILSAAAPANGSFLLTFTGTTDILAVEASTNFATWSALGTAPLTNGRGVFLDVPARTIPWRFYRLRQ
jgi:hypothetical protein